MTDTIIKGSGNSRTIKSVPNLAALAPTYDKLLELLTGQGLPVDIGALNRSGCVQIGNDLNKETLLKDSTAALYGKTAAATPDEILVETRKLISGLSTSAVKVATGSYTGNGSGKKSITLPFTPKLIVAVSSGSYDASTPGSGRYYYVRFFAIGAGGKLMNITVESGSSYLTSVSYYQYSNNVVDIERNDPGIIYYYTAFG